MQDQGKTREQLLEELTQFRRQAAAWEKPAADKNAVGPVATSEDESRRQSMTRTILTMMTIALGIFTAPVLIGSMAGAWDLQSTAVILLVDVLIGVSWWLCRQGRWRWGSYVAPMVMFALGLYGTYQGGLSTVFVLFYAIAILLVSMLRGGKATWFALALSVLTHIGVASFRDSQFADSVASAAITLGGALVGIALLQWLSTHQMEHALAHARGAAAALGAEVEERKRAEQALRESRNLFQSLIESLPLNIYSKDAQGRFVFANQRYCATEGKMLSEIVGKSDVDLHPSELADKYRRDDHQVIESGQTIEIVEEHQPTGKERFYVQVIKTPLYDAGGSITGTLGIFWDITDRRRAEAERARLIAILESTSDLVSTATPDHRLTYLNVAGRQMTGWDLDEDLAGRVIADLHPAWALERIERVGIPATLEKGAWEGETAILHRDGREIPVSQVILAHRSESGELQYLSTIMRDITARKQAEKALRRYADENARLLEAERQHRELAETLREVGATLAATLDADVVLDRLLAQVERVVPHDVANVMILEGDSVRIVRSRGYEKFGIDISAAYASHPFANVPNLVSMAESGQAVIVSDVSADPDWVRRSELNWRRSYVGVPILARGKAIGFLNVSASTPGYYTPEHAERLRAFADQAAIALENARLFAAEQQRAAELTRALDRQHELDRLQREFIQNVSHELRTPLALIRGHAEVMESGWLGELTAEQHESLGIITRRTLMLSRLVEDIMGILEVERQELKRELVDLAQLVRMVVADFQPSARNAGLTLVADIVPDLPRPYGDALALRRMLDNLVGNAFKFTQSGGQVTIRLDSSGKDLRLQVSDTGIGIAPDQLGRIFERFYQVDGSATRKYGGVGLGLALVKSIVEAHGGEIAVTSEVGRGTTFCLSIPVNKE